MILSWQVWIDGVEKVNEEKPCGAHASNCSSAWTTIGCGDVSTWHEVYFLVEGNSTDGSMIYRFQETTAPCN